jgi:hypothetical protein
MSEKRTAATLAYFLANVGAIDAPGSAEWRRRLKEEAATWNPSEMCTAFMDAQNEADAKTDEQIEAIWTVQ